MLSYLKQFIREEDGLGTVELVLLIAILVGLALMFRKTIVSFVQKVLRSIEGNELDPKTIEEGI